MSQTPGYSKSERGGPERGGPEGGGPEGGGPEPAGREHAGTVVIEQADYTDPEHAAALVRLLDAYARDPLGGAHPIPAARLSRLAGELSKRVDAFSVLAFFSGRAVGLVNCFESFSTFACRPLVNVHDVVVDADFRGRGIAGEMLAKVEQIAVERDCCKLTLEVLEGNRAAQQAYRRFGFGPCQLRPEEGRAMFWEKKLGGGQ